MLAALVRLNQKKDVFVYIISGRARVHLDSWFAETGIGLSAEHGCFYRHPTKLGPYFGRAGRPNEEEDDDDDEDEEVDGEEVRAVAEDEKQNMGKNGMMDAAAVATSKPASSSPTAIKNSSIEATAASVAVATNSLVASMDQATIGMDGNEASLLSDVVKRKSDGWFAHVDEVDSSYRDTIRPLLQHYTDRTPGSFIEEKEINLTWHYR